MGGAAARLAGLTVGIVLLLGGCGGDDGGGERQTAAADDPAQALKDVIAKTEAAGTARMTFDMEITGPEALKFDGEGIVDFENQRDHLTMQAEDMTIQMFNDAGEEYIRLGTEGRYERLAESEQSPVANNPADSLRYVGTDVIDVKETGDGCFEGELDFDRVIERVEKGREAEIPEQLRGLKAPVVACTDGEGRLVRYDVTLEAGDQKLAVRSKISDHGQAPELKPLGPDERPL